MAYSTGISTTVSDLVTAVLYDGARPCPPFGDPTGPL